MSSGEQETRNEADARKISESTETTCVVCFKSFEIFSIGECDHPVCYECSTRMRVLCQQNECPICRQGLSKVIFTNEKRTYRDLETKNRSELYNKKYKICFSNIQIQKNFYDLLEHPCPQCVARTFQSFDALKEHVRKQHELFYCDICTDNLNIFSFERRCYNRQELGMHRRKGDPDNTSHKGHPLCQYCDQRYLDRDELFRHLRREHYYCHFCDADGANQFYGNVDSLRDHFRAEHYLCEEGECAREQFTAVFRTDIDLRAHISNIHGKSMGKLQAKQARTLQLEITVGPRGRANQQEQSSAHLRSRGNNNDFGEMETMHNHYPVQNARTIDARNEQDFPSLSGTGSSAVTVVHPTMSIRAKTFGPAGLARTKENFPALGGGGNTIADTGPAHSANAKYNQQASALLKNQKVPQQKPNSGGSMVIHVSNRPNNNSNNLGKKVPNQIDFPALPGSSRSQSNVRKEEFVSHTYPNTNMNAAVVRHRSIVDDYASKGQTTTKFVQKENNKPSKKQQQQLQLQEDYVPPTISSINMNSVSAKHRSLVDDYVSQVQQSSKLGMVQKESIKPSKKSPEFSTPAPNLDTFDFPALAPGSAPTEASWIKSQRPHERENRKSKVAPAPLLNGPNYENSNSKKNNENKRETKKKSPEGEHNNNNNTKKSVKVTEKKPTQDSKKVDNTNKSNDTKSNTKQPSKEVKSLDNNNEIKATNKNNTNKPKERDTFMNDMNNKKAFPTLGSSSSSSSSAPPGFDFHMNEMKSAPPGFKSVTLNSVAKPTNNMTFTNSLGENYSIVPTHQYIPPPDLPKRNQQLVKHFQSALNSPEAVAEFRFISQKFREGVYKTRAFFEHCQAALKDQFDEIFPELLVLLPDINKQQELYLVYSQYLNSVFATVQQQKIKAMLSVCKNCKQIVLNADLFAHIQAHNLESNFPGLNESKSITAPTYRN